MEFRKMVTITLYAKQRHRCTEKNFGLCGRRQGWDVLREHVYYLGWNRSPAQVGCMRQVLGPGALGRPRGIGWRGRWEGASGWGIHVNPWLIHVSVWQKPLQYCKVISLPLNKNNEKKGNKWEMMVVMFKKRYEHLTARHLIWLFYLLFLKYQQFTLLLYNVLCYLLLLFSR